MTAAEIQAVRLELGRSMRAKEDTIAQRLLAKIEAENRQKQREKFARECANYEFAAAKRRRA